MLLTPAGVLLGCPFNCFAETSNKRTKTIMIAEPLGQVDYLVACNMPYCCHVSILDLLMASFTLSAADLSKSFAHMPLKCFAVMADQRNQVPKIVEAEAVCVTEKPSSSWGWLCSSLLSAV